MLVFVSEEDDNDRSIHCITGELMPAFILSLLFMLNIILPNTIVHADESIPPQPVKLTIQTYLHENNTFLAVSFENFPHWHTYWKNPGDAGLAVKNQFFINKKDFKLNEEEWPAPKRFIENGTQWAYGYEGNYTLFFRLEKSDLNKLSGKEITLKSSWLVCKHICIPGQKDVTFKIQSGHISSLNGDSLTPLSESELASRFMNLPKAMLIPEYLEFKLIKGQKEKTLVLTYEVKNTTDVTFLKDANLIYSFPSPPFNFEHENLTVKETSLLGITEISWDGEYSTPPEALPLDGKFKKPYLIKFLFNDPVQRKVIVVEKKFTSFDPSTPPPLQSNSQLLHPTSETPLFPAAPSNAQASNSLFYYLALAFFGG